AYLLYYTGNLAELPRMSNPDRRLLETPVELPSLSGRKDGELVADLLSGPDWSLVYARTSACEEQCIADIVRLRQVHLALGKELNRVQRVVIAPERGGRAGRDPTLVTAAFDDPGGAELL